MGITSKFVKRPAVLVLSLILAAALTACAAEPLHGNETCGGQAIAPIMGPSEDFTKEPAGELSHWEAPMPRTGQYASFDDYVQAAMNEVTAATYYPNFLSPAWEEAEAAVIDRKLPCCKKLCELEDLAPEGVLEVWKLFDPTGSAPLAGGVDMVHQGGRLDHRPGPGTGGAAP